MSNDSEAAGPGTEAGPRTFEPVYHRYVPHKTGLPHLPTYVRELWRRREFAFETSKASMRGATTNTFFGQAWLVLNPLLLSLVYYLLVTVISRSEATRGWEYFAHLTGGLFVFSVEESFLADYEVSDAGRFAHRRTYVQKVLTDSGFKVVTVAREQLRNSAGRPVFGMIFVAQKPA